MVHKLLHKDDWDSEWESTENSIRETCLEKGVHPVWHEMAQHTAILGQFAAFPKAKVSKPKAGKKVDLKCAYIDPFLSSELLVAIEGISPCIIDSECQVALRNVSSQLSSVVRFNRPLHSLR